MKARPEERDQDGKEERVGQSPVSERGAIGNSQAKCEDVQIGQNGRGDARDEKSRGNDVPPQAKTNGERERRMREDGGHAGAIRSMLGRAWWPSLIR